MAGLCARSRGAMKRLKSAIAKALIRMLGVAGYPWRAAGPEGGRFLVFSATGVGDTLWSTPAIRAIKAAYPDAKIDVVTTAMGRELLMHNPNISDVFVFTRGARGAWAFMKLAKLLRTRLYDTAFVFHISDRVLVPLVYLAGANRAMGYQGKYDEMDAVLDTAVDGNGLHYIDRRLMVAAARGVSSQGKALDLILTDKEVAATRRMLEERGVGWAAPVIGLHPGAQDSYKCWPARNFMELGRRAERELGCRVLVTGGASEVALARSVADGIDGALCLAGELSIRGLAATIKHLDALVSNDTGPMHMGFALGTGTVGIFCPTDPSLNGPVDVPNAYVVSMPPTCDPCAIRKCGSPICLEQITVDMAFRALADALKHGARPATWRAN